ncbi:MAG: InlB B-repeat-containing protein, partial [Paludibacteraceae bacterium]|nr:InlB B-repeat-containing protein [Paludibacteraceae bacterium]
MKTRFTNLFCFVKGANTPPVEAAHTSQIFPDEYIFAFRRFRIATRGMLHYAAILLMLLTLGIGEMRGATASLTALPTGTTSLASYSGWSSNEKTRNKVIYDDNNYFMMWSNGNDLTIDATGFKIGNSSKKSAFVFKVSAVSDISVGVARNGSDMDVSLCYMGTSMDVLTDPNSDASGGGTECDKLSLSSSTTSGTLTKSLGAAGYYKVFGTLRFYATSITVSAPSCAAPTAFSTTSVTSTSATLSITDGTNVGTYDIYYNTASTAPTSGTTPTITVTTKTPTITGLTEGTTYYCWVRSNCGSSSKSSWVALSGSTFATNKLIYLKNSMGWSNAYVTLLGTSSYWDDTDGSGSYGKTTYTMSYDSDKKLFYVEVPAASNDTYLAFTKDKQESYGNFYNTEAIYVNGGYSFGKVVWVSTSTTFTKNGTKYYQNTDLTGVEKEDYSADVYLVGSHNSWTKNDAAKFTSGTPFTKTVSLTAGTVYTFKVVDNAWFGIDNTWLMDDKSGLMFSQSDGNINLLASITGDYTFTYNRSTHAVAVTYPTHTHPCSGYVYIIKYDWGGAYLHTWYDGDHPMTSWGSDLQLSYYEEICGTDYWCIPVLSYYANFIVKDNAGDPSNTTNDQSFSSNGGKNMYHDGSSWGWHSFATYSITFAGNGSDGGSMTNVNGICPSGSHTLAANGFTKTGYTFSNWKTNVAVTANSTSVAANGVVPDEAALSSIGSDITLTAQWSQIMVSSISLNKSSTTLSVGGTETLVPTISPATALDKTVTWESDDEDVATVDEDGVVTAVGQGTCTITATAHDGSGEEATCEVTVSGFSVTYNGNGRTGGTAVPGDATAYDPGDEVTVKAGTGMTKTGYTFLGWSDGTTLYRDGQKFNITANTTLTAQWDGTGSSVTLTHFGKQFKTSDPRRGYAYVGSTSGTKYIIESNSSDVKNSDSDSSAIVLPYSNKFMKVLGPGATTNIADSLFSNVTQISFKWKYVASTTTYTTGIDVYVGNTKVETKSLTGNKNDSYATATVSNIASKSGTVKFVNTGTSSSNQKFWFDDITITCGTPSSAKAVTFDKGGQSGATGMPSNFSVPSGSKILEPSETPTVSNYTFGGWVTTSGGSTPFDFSATITSDKTIYAKWNAKTAPTTSYTFTVGGVSYGCDEGSGVTCTLSGSQSGWSYQLYKNGAASGDAKAGTSSALTWTGLTAGTYTVKTVETSTQATAQIGSAVTVYDATIITTNLGTSKSVNANAANTYSIAATGAGLTYQWFTCNSTGGDKVAISGEKAASMSHTFTNGDAPTKYICCVVTGDCGDPVTSNIMTVTVTPTYTLTVNMNGGSAVAGLSTGYKAAGSFVLPGTIPTKSGYVFMGYLFSTNSTVYQPGATVTMPAANATLTAQWETACATVTDAKKGTWPGSDPTTGTEITSSMINGTITGATVKTTGSAALGCNANYGLVFDADNTKEITIILTGGVFEAGTVIEIGACGTDNTSSHTCGFTISGKAPTPATTTSSEKGNAFTQRYVVTTGDGIDGGSSIVLKRKSGTAKVYFKSLTVAGCLSCTPVSPTLNYSATTLYANGGVPNTATPTLDKDGSTSTPVWSSSNTNVVTVNSTTGVITAVGAGTATISATLDYDGTHCGAVATSSTITVPALVTQTINLANSETAVAWGTPPNMTFLPSDKGMTQGAVIAKGTFTFDETETISKANGGRYMTASFTGTESSKGKYLTMSFSNTNHKVKIGSVIVPFQPISNDGKAQVEIYEGSTLRMTSTEVTGIKQGKITDVRFSFPTEYTFAKGSTINVRIYFYGQTNGFRLASPILVSGGVQQWTLTYDANDGTGAPASESRYYNDNSALSATTPTREGFSFAGWQVNGEGTVYAASSTSYAMAASDVTMVAKWLCSVTYHSATEDDHVVENVAPGGSVEAYTPAACAGKTFVGWTDAEVTSLLQIDPTTNATGAIASVTGNTELYAVFASQNGAVMNYDFNSYTTSTDYTKNNTYGIWNVERGAVSAEEAVTSKMGSNALAMQMSSSAATILKSSRIIKNFKGISCQLATTDNNAYFKIQYSTNGTDWTDIVARKNHDTFRTKTTEGGTIATATDAYVRVRGDGNGSYKIYIDDIVITTSPDSYALSDYSTTCDKASTPSLTWRGIQDYAGNTDGLITKTAGADMGASVATGTVLTLPTLVKDSVFSHWKATINGVELSDEYAAGEPFLVNHDVTLTAHWTPYAESGAILDIVDWQNNNIVVNANGYSSSTTPLPLRGGYTQSELGTSDRNADRTLTVYAGKKQPNMMALIAADGASAGQRYYRVPYQIDEPTNSSDLSPAPIAASVIRVHAGGELTIDADLSVSAVYVDPGAKLVISSGKTLTVSDKFVLRTAPFASAEFENNGTLTLSGSAKVYYTRVVSNKT